MYPPPVGTSLTAEQARELDDTFLSSDPLAYFRSRIRSLIAWSEASTPLSGQPSSTSGSPRDSGSEIRGTFFNHLRQFEPEQAPSGMDIDAQVAADALSVRQHAAEVLLTFAAVRLHPDPFPESRCLWEAVATGPRTISEVRDRVLAGARAPDPGARFLRAVVPQPDRERVAADADSVAGINVYSAWLAHASDLLQPGTMDVQAGHNKTKHGLAVRARADMRMSLVAPQDGLDPAALPVSSISDAIAVFDRPVLEFLSRPGKIAGARQGLELTQLQLDAATLLAEAEMLAMTHGAMFHVAAAEHFAGRDDLEEHLVAPPHPGYPSRGPKPQDIDPDAVVGMRFPLTNPPGGGNPARRGGIGFRNGMFVELTVGERTTGRLVEG